MWSSFTLRRRPGYRVCICWRNPFQLCESPRMWDELETAADSWVTGRQTRYGLRFFVFCRDIIFFLSIFFSHSFGHMKAMSLLRPKIGITYKENFFFFFLVFSSKNRFFIGTRRRKEKFQFFLSIGTYTISWISHARVVKLNYMLVIESNR